MIRKIILVLAVATLVFSFMVVPSFAYTGSIGTDRADVYYYHTRYAPSYRMTGRDGAYNTTYSDMSMPMTFHGIVYVDDTYVESDETFDYGYEGSSIQHSQTATITQYTDSGGQSIQPIDVTRTITYARDNTYDDMISQLIWSGLNNRWMSAPSGGGSNNYNMFGGARYVWNDVIFDKTSTDLYDGLYVVEYVAQSGRYTDYVGIDIYCDVLLADEIGFSYSQRINLSGMDFEPVMGYKHIDNSGNSTRMRFTLRDILGYIDEYCFKTYKQSIYRRNEVCFISDLVVTMRTYDENGVLPPGYSIFNNEVGVTEEGSLASGRRDMSAEYTKWYNNTVATTTDFDFLGWLSDTIGGVLNTELFGVGDFRFTLGSIVTIVFALAIFKLFINKFAGG